MSNSSMYVFTPKSEFVMFYWLYKTRIGGRSYSSTTGNLLDFLHKQN